MIEKEKDDTQRAQQVHRSTIGLRVFRRDTALMSTEIQEITRSIAEPGSSESRAETSIYCSMVVYALISTNRCHIAKPGAQ